MWPFKIKTRKVQVQLRISAEKNFTWYSVWIKQSGSLFIPGYWKYICGTSDRDAAKTVYDSCCINGEQDGDVILEQQL